MVVINDLSCPHIPFFFQVASLAALFLEVAETTCSLSIFALSRGGGGGEGRRKEERKTEGVEKGEQRGGRGQTSSRVALVSSPALQLGTAVVEDLSSVLQATRSIVRTGNKHNACLTTRDPSLNQTCFLSFLR